MGNLLSYSGIVTKIHAMQAKLLTDDHFREIAQLRNVAEVASNAATALQGKIPGVSVASSSGDPNGSMTINVRGISSLSNNDPLYVIDGSFGDISMVDPNDITSIEVLKDAASAAIYGSRAAGGVILITTKSCRIRTALRPPLPETCRIPLLPSEVLPNKSSRRCRSRRTVSSRIAIWTS